MVSNIAKRAIGIASQLALIGAFFIGVDALYRYRSLLETMSPRAFREGLCFLILGAIGVAMLGGVVVALLLLAAHRSPRWSGWVMRMVQTAVMTTGIAVFAVAASLLDLASLGVAGSVLTQHGALVTMGGVFFFLALVALRRWYGARLDRFAGSRAMSAATLTACSAVLLIALAGAAAAWDVSVWTTAFVVATVFLVCIRHDVFRVLDVWFLAAVPAGILLLLVGISTARAYVRDHSAIEHRAPIVIHPKRVYPGIDHIIVVSFDALSAERMSLYGNPRVTTPNLDALGAESFVFERMHAEADATQQSLAAMQTGVHYATNRLRAYGRHLAGEDLVGYVPRVFDALGWDSSYALFSPNPGHNDIFSRIALYNDASPDLLERFYGPRAYLDLRRIAARYRFIPSEWIAALMDGYGGRLREQFSRFDTDLADTFFAIGSEVRPGWQKLGWAERYLTESLPAHAYLRIHTYAPHQPYHRVEPYASEFLPDRGKDYASFLSAFVWNGPPIDPQYDPTVREFQLLYEGYVKALDAEFGKFLDFLRTTGLYDRTMLIVTADHGAAFAHQELFHLNRLFYEQTMRVPFIVHLPGQHTGMRIPEYAQHVDIKPTILDLLGVEVSPWMDGDSLRPLMERESSSKNFFRDRITFSQGIPPPFELRDDASLHDRYAFAAYRAPYKLIYRFVGNRQVEEIPATDVHASFFVRYPRIELFNLERDPGEITNIADREPAVRDELFAAVQERIAGIQRLQKVLQ